MKIKVHVLSARTVKGHGCTYPFRVFKQQIKEKGISVKIFHVSTPSLTDCDVLCLFNEAFRRKRNPITVSKNKLEFLESCRLKGCKLIWFDDTDSTSTPQFEVLPFVDLYGKCQLLKDLSAYTKAMCKSVYQEYYCQHFGIEEECKDLRRPALTSQLYKLHVSWNFGFWDYHTFDKWGRRLRVFIPMANYNFKNTSPDVYRPIDVSYRVGMHSQSPSISFHRKKLKEHLEELLTAGKYRIAFGKKLSYREYRRELSMSKVIPSPFGFGEICPRDFECFLAGAVLLKPDMAHLETWPNYYIPEITYVPFKWDFSDFADKLVSLLEDDTKRIEIASAGQKVYLESLSSKGGEAFAKRFSDLVAKAISNSGKPVNK